MSKGLVICIFSFALLSCGSADNAQDSPNAISGQKIKKSDGEQTKILVNQIGFLPQQHKLAVIKSEQSQKFSVINADTREVVFEGTSSAPKLWPYSDEIVSIADFSEVSVAGNYLITVNNEVSSVTFGIEEEVYSDIHDAGIKAYYFNRAGMALDKSYAGKWQRSAGHPDTQVMVHSSAATKERPEGTVLSSPKGWYDAGDYNKYIVNSGITTYTLMRAYIDNQNFYQNRDFNIPESGDQTPDLLDEILWNLDWMATMQDTDGGVYHKLTTLRFSPADMPEDTTKQRYVVAKGTSASLNFAAVLSVASRVFPEKREQYLQQARHAWQWALANPDVKFKNPSDVSTGEYGDKTLTDEFAWAAAELFISTGEDEYWQAFNQYKTKLATPSWSNTSLLGYFSILADQPKALADADYQLVQNEFLSFAKSIKEEDQASAYRVAMNKKDFVWGSNAVALNKASVLWHAWRLTDDTGYKDAALNLVDYVLGRNPVDITYITGFGSRSPMHIHHRPSQADGIEDPIPGFVAGGAHSGQQDKCSYPSKLPALSYSDTWCSYASNEIAINWNAPFVYMMSSILAD
ncbi:glycoside hydrolase family 9 protein [Glaciecola sp. 1036]|uniref:glycoside hydrolase family 9 protein n=1 Tax=Alteromonadaceae TaxID=72275 RepID=UPI003CFBD2C2